jgi:uncharacterized protein
VSWLKHGFVLTRFFANDIIRDFMPQQSAQFPLIDGFKFATAGGRAHGTWPVSAFPRLRDLLLDDSGAIEYEVSGSINAHGQPQLALRASGTLRMTCRRCLGALEFAPQVDTTLLLASTQAEVDAEPMAAEGPDSIVATKEMSLRDLVEDELLLALPYAPRHEVCAVRAERAPQAGQTPFAGLRSKLRGDK